MGAGLTVPGLFVLGAVTGIISNVASGIDQSLGAIVSLVLGGLGLAALIYGLVVEKLRFYALGVIAALGLLAILAAGACIVLIMSLANAY